LRVLTSRRLDLVRALGLDGVQLAADAVPVDEARRWLGPDIWIGYSAHSGQEARLAAARGVSFVTLSPIHDTESKPGTPGRGTGWLANETRGLSVPALALGGMTADRAGAALAAGAWGVAAVSAIGAASDPERAAREFTKVVEGS
jgi:thiamine-phosphate diphosphorylase